jgi:hypothetical protein
MGFQASADAEQLAGGENSTVRSASHLQGNSEHIRCPAAAGYFSAHFLDSGARAVFPEYELGWE